MSKSHPDVSFEIEEEWGGYNSKEEAFARACVLAASRGKVILDVVVFSEAGARWWGGEDSVESYRQDPDCSVLERLEITVNNLGRIA